jgi:hypothetical protein
MAVRVRSRRASLALLSCMFAEATAVPVPSDWADGVAKGDLLFAADPTPSSLSPSLENGFIGGDVGCSGGSGSSAGHLSIAGLYSGGTKKTERATIPNPLASEPLNALYNGSALNVAEGIFLERWQVSGCEGMLQSKRYAHRQHRSLLVLELSMVSTTNLCNVTLKTCAGGPGGMVLKQPGVWEVIDPEQPAAGTSFPRRQPASAAMANDQLPEFIMVGPSSKPTLFLAVVHTTLEPAVSSAFAALSLAKDDLTHYHSIGVAALAQAHSDAWADVFAGGIEVEGNHTLAAQVNASLYYLLSSVRGDWPWGVSEGGIGSNSYNGHIFWSDGVMDGPLFTAISAPIADALMQYRIERLPAAKAIASLNGYSGAYWPWQSAVTGFEQSCGNISVAMIMNSKPRIGCYWMHELHVGADLALYFRMNYWRSGGNNLTYLNSTIYPLVSATADYFASRVNRSSTAANWTLNNVIGPDEHSYVQNGNTYTNYAAGQVMLFAVEAAELLGRKPASLEEWRLKGSSMSVPLKKYCLSWRNASVDGCPAGEVVTIHPQYEGYHGEDINQADVALLQWPLHATMDSAVALDDLRYYAQRSSGSDTKGFYTGDSSYAIAMLFMGQAEAAAAQFQLAFHHMVGAFNIWTETDPTVAHGMGHLNFLTGAG